MAIQNDPRLYTGGGVVFNTKPSVHLYAQLAARRQAKNDAFDEYIRNLNKGINSAGLRNQDRPIFDKKLADWQKFAIENRDAIRSRKNGADIKFMQGYQDMLNLINESKTAEESKKPLVEILLDPNKRNRLSQRVFPAIASHDQPIEIIDENGNYVRNPNRKQIDYNNDLFDPQFDFSKAFPEWSKGHERTKQIGEVVQRDKVTGQAIRAFTKAYTPEQIKQISLNAARSVEDNPEYGNYYQLKFENIDPMGDDYSKLNEAFQSVHGKEIQIPGGKKVPNVIDSPDKLAAAEAILQSMALTEKGTEDELDRQLATDRARFNIYLNNAGAGGGNLNQQNEFDRIPDVLSLPKVDGLIYNREGTKPFNGNWGVLGSNIPAQTRAILKTGGIEIKGGRQYQLDIRNGKLWSINENDGKLVADRTDMDNAQIKWNTEAKTATQPRFGEREIPKPKPSFPSPPKPKPKKGKYD